MAIRDKELHCWKCMFITKSSMKLRDHVASNHKKSRTCDICHGVFTTHYSMLTHMKSCGREPDIECLFCNYMTNRPENLRGHIQRKHPDLNLCHADGFECSKCNKKYKKYQSFKLHNKICVDLNRIDSVVENQQVQDKTDKSSKDEAE